MGNRYVYLNELIRKSKPFGEDREPLKVSITDANKGEVICFCGEKCLEFLDKAFQSIFPEFHNTKQDNGYIS